MFISSKTELIQTIKNLTINNKEVKQIDFIYEILAPKFYNKYKDLEVEIDDKGNVLRWIGEINRDKKY
ncbi:hypothetical protein AEI20_06205 [Campylobacter jejuni]|uniref:hypothetical protein n=1 Tax=Campylobacter jejuni TaxID=197 RepID=UPI000E20F9A5|nr:hypothetical protein [Campylobacter jejuni]AXL42344.1 hypothetical protein AEI20_06205 [Campylobacter jejuni]UWN10008.1 hypothetical protein AEI19_04960 [Campylobacter jejuni]